MSQTWTILINETPPHFNVDAFGYKPGEPLRAQLGDLVSWNNQTTDRQEIGVMKPGGGGATNFEVIAESYKPSSPGYVLQAADMSTHNATENVAGTIDYRSLNLGWRATITVVKS